MSGLTTQRLRRRIFGQLWTLAVQFVLGVVLTIIGSEATGNGHVVYIVVFVLHVVTAIGLIEGAVYIVVKAHSRLNWAILVVLALTFVSGGLTVWTGNDMWSFVMAVGFLGVGWLYGIAYVRADRALRVGG